MKKTLLCNGAAVMLLAMAAACSSDDIDELPLEAPEQSRPTMTIIATQGDDAESRIAYTPSSDGKQIDMTWTEGDALIVTDATCSAFVELTLAEGAGTNKGTFTTTATLPTTWSSTTALTAHYKANRNMYYADEYYTLFQPLKYFFTLTQTANGNMEHLKAQNYMQSATFTYAAGESVNLKFSQMGAIMKFSLSGMGGQTVKSLKLLAGERVFNTNYDINGSYYDSEQTLLLGENEAGITLAAGDNLTAYMMLGTTELTDGKSLTLVASTSDGAYYSATLNGGKLEAGKIYSLSKEMEKYEAFTQGTGTEADPYQLSTVADLEKLDKWIDWGLQTEGVYFRLQNDIDLSTVCGEGKGNWTPIGRSRNFKGTFDGNGKTISNLYINDPSAESVAFFSAVNAGGVLKDLHVNGSVSASMYAVGVVAYCWGTVSGCTFSGTVSAAQGGAAGIVGALYNSAESKIVGCTNYGTISATYHLAGGIVAYAYCPIIACYNAGAVSAGQEYGQGSIAGIADYYDFYDSPQTAVIGCYDATTSLSIIGSTEGTVTETANYTKSTVTDWATAMTAMNSAISSYGWKYVANTDETTKANEPLKLEKFMPDEPESAE